MSSSVADENPQIYKDYVKNLLDFFSGPDVIFGKESPKSLVLGALEIVKNRLSLCEFVSGEFRRCSNDSFEFHLSKTEVGVMEG